MKIFKNNFFKSTFILIFSGLATKGLGLIIKIIFTRIAGTKTISLYTIVMPTYSLLITIASFAMPTTIAKLIAEKNNPKILNSASIIIFILNFIIVFIMFLISPFIANNLLKEKDTYYLLISMSLTLPFASIACILKGYFYGKQKMLPHVISNTIEQIIRIILILTIIPILVKKSYIYAACGLLLTSVITEFASIVIFLIFMNKKDLIILKNVSFNKDDAKDIFNLSIPNVSGRIIGNICYFLEPIILTNVLLYNGYSHDYILLEYGIYNAYAISTLTIPSFFINAICLALIPEISKFIGNNNIYLVKKRLKEAFIFTFIIGISFTLLIYIFRNELLIFLYNSTKGGNYIKILAPFFILFYFENIFASFMQATNNTKISFRITIIGSIIKLISLITLSFLKIGIYSLIISEIINIIIVVLFNFLCYKKILKKL